MSTEIYKGLVIEDDKVVRCDYIELDEDDDEYYEPAYVVIPEGIREICQDAFADFPQELYIEFPSTLEIIGDYAFYGCEFDFELEDELPIGLKEIGAHAFEKCSLTHLNLPQGLKEIGEYAFANNELGEVFIPKSVCKIGQGAFSSPDAVIWDSYKSVEHIALEEGNEYFKVQNNCLVDFIRGVAISHTDSSVEKIEIPYCVRYIGAFAFSNLENLSIVSLNMVEKIGYAAFLGCYNLNAHIDIMTDKIEQAAFSNVKSISVDDSIDFKYRVENGCLIDSNGCLLSVDQRSVSESCFIPYGVKSIGNYAFVNCDKIRFLDFSFSHVKSIGTYAFKNCKNLKHIDFQLDLTYIGFGAFEDCKSLSYVDFPRFLHTIGIRAFHGCNEVKSIMIPSSVCEVGECAFGVDWIYSSHLDPISNTYIESYPKKIDIYCEEWTSIESWDENWSAVKNDIVVHEWCKFKYDVNGIPDFDWGDEEDDEMEEDVIEPAKAPEFTNDEILYIYKGNIRCHRYGHHIIQATAILHNKTDNEIELNIEYCTECKKFILEYTVFEQYRNRYGVLVGNFRMVVNGEFDGEYDLAEESPLMLSGYNVNQRDGYTTQERHYILARIIHDGIMEKGDVIRYLSYFIRKNGVKRGNELALSKWEEDLAFVQEYDKSTQPKAIISDIRKY